MEKIKAEISANWNDRNISGKDIEINFSEESKGLWFNINLSSNKEDDYITVSMKLNGLLEAIGKAVESPEDNC